MATDDVERDILPVRRRDEPREGSALGGRKGDDGLIGATGRDVGGQAGEGWLGVEERDGEDGTAP